MLRNLVLSILVFSFSLLTSNLLMAWGGPPSWARSNAQTLVNYLPKEPLSQAEVNYLIMMRQEEKLARDVYRTLYQVYGLRIFDNIARSEQRHMDSVKLLLDKYGIPDPLTSDEIGEFRDAKFKKLYQELVSRGKTSLVEALKVGKQIEELDISDLDKALKVVDNQDIKLVFSNLRRGSQNHLRAFCRHLSFYGEQCPGVDLSPGGHGRRGNFGR